MDSQDQEHTLLLIACPECDLIEYLNWDATSPEAICVRCGAQLPRASDQALDRVLPITVAASILFVIANTAPILAIEAVGTRNAASLIDAIATLATRGAPVVATVVAVTALIIPIVELLTMIYVLSSLPLKKRLWGVPSALQFLGRLHPWAMVEVFLLGVLVSLVKLAGIARVIPGVGLWSLAGFIVLMALARRAFDGPSYWRRLERFG